MALWSCSSTAATPPLTTVTSFSSEGGVCGLYKTDSVFHGFSSLFSLISLSPGRYYIWFANKPYKTQNGLQLQCHSRAAVLQRSMLLSRNPEFADLSPG